MTEQLEKVSPYDPYSTEENEKLEKDAERIRKRDLGDIRKILSIPEGRRFFWRLLSEAGIFRSSFTGDSLQTAHNEGRREIGLIFLKDINAANPSSFAQLQREFVSEQNSKENQ